MGTSPSTDGRNSANAAAQARLAAAEPVLVDVRRAADVAPGLGSETSVFVVEDRASGVRAFSPLAGRRRDADEARLVEDVVARVVRDAVTRQGGVPLKPIFQGALKLGDELQMRARGASILWTTAIFPALLDVALEIEPEVRRTLAYLENSGDDWFFRLAAAASRVVEDAAHGVPMATLVTGVTIAGGEMAIRVSGLGDEWFRAPLSADLPAGEVVVLDSVGLGVPRPPREDRTDASDLTGFTCWAMRSSLEVFKVLATDAAPLVSGFAVDSRGALVEAINVECPRGCFEAAAEAHRSREVIS